MTTELTVDRLPTEYIDPDPYTVVACWIAAASLALQFVDFARNVQHNPPSISQSTAITTNLEQLENSLEEIERLFDLLIRTIERGSRHADSEFFEAEFGIGKSSLLLESSRHSAFSTQLADTFGKLSALSLWANHVIGNQPDAAALLGQAIMADLSHASDRLNGLMRTGAKNREMIAECRMVIETLRLALNVILKSSSN